MSRKFSVAFFIDHNIPSKHGSIGIGLPGPEIYTAISSGQLILKTAWDTGGGLLELI